jgi:hypothetical protein
MGDCVYKSWTRRKIPLSSRRVEFGDWQTPEILATHVVEKLRSLGHSPASIVEPTCGIGAFVVAAMGAFPTAKIHGYEHSSDYLATAKSRCPKGIFHHRDFFDVDWNACVSALPSPVLFLGNPPWVTASILGALGADNLPTKSNFKSHRGMDARTGKANFDISEWMILRLIEASLGKDFVLAMLCKSSVARRVLEMSHARGWSLTGSMFGIDTRVHFHAAVDAVLLVVSPSRVPKHPHWQLYKDLDATVPVRHMGMDGTTLFNDLQAYEQTLHLAGPSTFTWRSGIKHDCTAVMQLTQRNSVFYNGLGEAVDVEPSHVFPLLKGTDVANGRHTSCRYVIVTQQRLGEDTTHLQHSAPKTWNYLQSHGDFLSARKSSIYKNAPPFAIFGVGSYSFAPFKVATS